MGRYCAIDRDEIPAGVSLHLFPFNDPERLKAWILSTGREFWVPSKSSVVCGRHFEARYIIIKENETGRKCILTKDAVPTLNLPEENSHRSYKEVEMEMMDRRLEKFFSHQPSAKPHVVIVLTRMGIKNFDQLFDLLRSKVFLEKRLRNLIQYCRSIICVDQLKPSKTRDLDMVISKLTQQDIEEMVELLLSIFTQGRRNMEALARFIDEQFPLV